MSPYDEVPKRKADSGPAFWETMHLLVDKEWKKCKTEATDDVRDWVDKVVSKKNSKEVKIDEVKREMSRESDVTEISENLDEEIKTFLKSLDLPSIDCKISLPLVRVRLEKLMGSNLVSLTDRDYMQRLQFRVLEDYAQAMAKRIKNREIEEMERIKNLVLTGKVPFSEAPPEMADHPVILIDNYCNKLIAERRAKIRVPKVYIPKFLYYDDTPDPPSGLSIENGHMFRPATDRICCPPTRFLEPTDAEDIKNGYMMDAQEFERRKYEDDMVKQLKSCQTVDELYNLADRIIGGLKTMAGRNDDTFSKMTANTGLF